VWFVVWYFLNRVDERAGEPGDSYRVRPPRYGMWGVVYEDREAG